MPLGIAGIVTNTVVLNQYAKPYGSVIDLMKAYLDITDKPVVMEIDGHTVDDLLAVGKVFHRPVGSDYSENSMHDKWPQSLQHSQG